MPDWNSDYISLAFVGYNPVPVWNYQIWMKVVKELDFIVAQLSEKILLRSTQDCDEKDLKFGQIRWDEKGHAKWTHASPVNSPDSSRWRFIYADAFSPSAKACADSDRAPDFFVSIESPDPLEGPKKGQFNQFFHLALPVEFARKNEAGLRAAAANISGLMQASEAFARKTIWYDDEHHSVMDTLNNFVRYYGMLDSLKYDYKKARGEWKSLAAVKI